MNENAIPLSDLAIKKESPPTGGAEKDVFPIILNGIQYAAKIFLENNRASEEPINRESEAIQEFELATLLQNTPLAKMIPKPFSLISDEKGLIIGLIVEWRNGIELAEIYSNREEFGLTKEMFDELERLVLSIQNIRLNDDCLSEGNICIGDGQLWIAEVRLRTDYKDNDHYKERVKQLIELLRKDYLS